MGIPIIPLASLRQGLLQNVWQRSRWVNSWAGLKGYLRLGCQEHRILHAPGPQRLDTTHLFECAHGNQRFHLGVKWLVSGHPRCTFSSFPSFSESCLWAPLCASFPGQLRRGHPSQLRHRLPSKTVRPLALQGRAGHRWAVTALKVRAAAPRAAVLKDWACIGRPKRFLWFSHH